MANRKAKAKRIARRAERIDVRAGKTLAQARHQPLVNAICKVGALADQPPLLALSTGTLVAGALLGRPRLARCGLRMIASHALATFAKGWIKHRVDRHRPHVEHGDHRIKPGEIADESARNSFPSGHSAGAVAVARAVARDYPANATPAMAAAGFAVVAPLPAARHFPVDVVAGTAIGLAAEAIVTWITDPRGGAANRA